MATLLQLKRNDTVPAAELTLKDADGNVVDVSGATVRFHMKGPKPGTEVKVDAAATVDDGPNGDVSYSWQSGDTDTAGFFDAEFEVTFTDGTIRSFPVPQNFTIVIYADLS